MRGAGSRKGRALTRLRSRRRGRRKRVLATKSWTRSFPRVVATKSLRRGHRCDGRKPCRCADDEIVHGGKTNSLQIVWMKFGFWCQKFFNFFWGHQGAATFLSPTHACAQRQNNTARARGKMGAARGGWVGDRNVAAPWKLAALVSDSWKATSGFKNLEWRIENGGLRNEAAILGSLSGVPRIHSAVSRNEKPIPRV